LYWLNPTDNWWQGAGLASKVGHLLAMIVLAVMTYFGCLFALGIRKAHLLPED
jgi:peptidoglycan biosynthesis protein MviN/MurJ (putative lipid II flippase)